MDDLGKLKKVLEDRIEKEDDALRKIKILSSLVPDIQRQKEADEFTLKLIKVLPNDFVEENAQGWLSFEIEKDKQLSANFPDLSTVKPDTGRVFAMSTSGSASPYILSASGIVAPFVVNPSSYPEWVTNVMSYIDEYSARIAQQEYIPKRLDLLNQDLGKMFEVAVESYRKCKSNIVTVDQAAIHLRDVLQQVWGGLVEMARKNNQDDARNTNNLQLSKEGDRDLVATILANDFFPKSKQIILLADLYSLHYKLSDTRFGKNPLNPDFPLLNNYYNEWLTILDGISGLVV